MFFSKMHGCGNDYVFIDCFSEIPEQPSELAIRLSDRHFGVGGDGLVLICKSNLADAKMLMYNADGSEGRMCGNAIRCVGKLLYDLGRVGSSLTVETLSGVKLLKLILQDEKCIGATVDMGTPSFAARDIPARLEYTVNTPLEVDGSVYAVTCVSVGNPHCVVFCEQNVDTLPIDTIGKLFEQHPIFPERVNTEFVNLLAPNRLKMRVWERGSGETLACGTGACASVAAAVANNLCERNTNVSVELSGGVLAVNYSASGNILLTGPAVKVFDGTLA